MRLDRFALLSTDALYVIDLQGSYCYTMRRQPGRTALIPNISADYRLSVALANAQDAGQKRAILLANFDPRRPSMLLSEDVDLAAFHST